MKNLKGVLTSIVTVTLAFIVLVTSGLTTTDAATKRKTVVAVFCKSISDFPIIKKTGYYTISVSGGGNDLHGAKAQRYWAFKAPKDGTYYFKIDSLKDENGTAEKSYCDMEIEGAKRVYVAKYGYALKRGEMIGADYYDYTLNFTNSTTGYNDSEGTLASPDYLAMLAFVDKYGANGGYDYEKAKSLVSSYVKKSGSAQSSYTIKCKLEKGEKVYFRNYYMNNATYNTTTSGEYNLKIVCK